MTLTETARYAADGRKTICSADFINPPIFPPTAENRELHAEKKRKLHREIGGLTRFADTIVTHPRPQALRKSRVDLNTGEYAISITRAARAKEFLTLTPIRLVTSASSRILFALMAALSARRRSS